MKLNINILKQIFFLVVLLSLLVLPYFVFAQENVNTSSNNPIDKLENIGSGEQGFYAEATPATFSTIIGQAVKVLLSFLGIIFIALMIIAGYHWMTAEGNQEEITKAKGSIKSSIIGLIIVVGAYAIWELISSQLL
ncbi:MAG TPA: pilin [Patescibacteria group bacterium]|nr:pilin [Patescibacteria group bacterium]